MLKHEKYLELSFLKGRIREQHTSQRKYATELGLAVPFCLPCK